MTERAAIRCETCPAEITEGPGGVILAPATPSGHVHRFPLQGWRALPSRSPATSGPCARCGAALEPLPELAELASRLDPEALPRLASALACHAGTCRRPSVLPVAP